MSGTHANDRFAYTASTFAYKKILTTNIKEKGRMNKKSAVNIIKDKIISIKLTWICTAVLV